MITIYKYPLIVVVEQEIEMPVNAEILSLQVQDGKMCIWALVDTSSEMYKRNVKIAGTGKDASNITSFDKYIGTVQMPPFVWHVFISEDAPF